MAAELRQQLGISAEEATRLADLSSQRFAHLSESVQTLTMLERMKGGHLIAVTRVRRKAQPNGSPQEALSAAQPKPSTQPATTSVK